MRAKDKCPSCFQPVAPTDFLCANCELILDPSQAPERPVGDVSVVRRMLEAPQRGLPSQKPNPKPPRSAPTEGLEGPTRKLDLGPELSGVPVVVATLTGKAVQLSEFEAWVVSLIDGLSDAAGLAKTTGVRELELRVVLRTLNEKHIIDFADEPLSDADLDMPSVMGTLDEEEDELTAPGILDAPPPANIGANTDRRDARFAAPPARASSQRSIPPIPDVLPLAPARSASVVPPIPDQLPLAPARSASAIPPIPDQLPLAPARSVSAIPPIPDQLPLAPARRGPIVRAGRAAIPPAPPVEALLEAGFLEREHTPIVQGRAEPPMLKPVEVPYPAASAEERAGLPPSRAVNTRPPAPPLPKPERTDPRIAYSGNVNRKVLDALKKVKRADGVPTSAPKEEPIQPVADVLARDTLQVALRMEQGGRLDEAIRFLEKSISQSPEAASLYNRLGIILMRERADYRRAETLIRKATELAPDNKVYSTNLQQVLSQHALRGR